MLVARRPRPVVRASAGAAGSAVRLAAAALLAAPAGLAPGGLAAGASPSSPAPPVDEPPVVLESFTTIVPGGEATGRGEAAPGGPSGVVTIESIDRPGVEMGVRPGQVAGLLRPEVLRRHLPLLVEELALDRDQQIVVASLLEDYAAAFAIAAEPLEDALGRFRRQASDRSVVRMLERGDATGGAAVAVVGAATRGGGARRLVGVPGEGGADGAITFVVGATVPAEGGTGTGGDADETGDEPEAGGDRRSSLLERVRSRLEAAERAGELVTARDLVRLARRLRAERQLLRTELIELIGLVAEPRPEAAPASGSRSGSTERVARAFALVRVDAEAPHGRLGGEAMDLQAALAAAGAPATVAAAVTDELDAARPVRAAALARRLEAVIDREITGLAVLAARERREAAGVEPDGTASPEVERHAAAARRELDARLAVRDDRIAALDRAEAMIAEADPAAAARLRDAALRRGFRAAARPRWAERAVQRAEELEDLDATMRAALAGVAAEVEAASRSLREQRVASWMREEPVRIRERIDAMLESEAGLAVAFGGGGPDEARRALREAQKRLDDRVLVRLATILTPEMVARLPSRVRTIPMEGGRFRLRLAAPTED